MNEAKLTKIAPGLYACAKGTVRNIANPSGAPHTRSARARWLINYATGKTRLVPSLSLARVYLA